LNIVTFALTDHEYQEALLRPLVHCLGVSAFHSLLRFRSLYYSWKRGRQDGPGQTISMRYHISFLIINSIHATVALSLAVYAVTLLISNGQHSLPIFAFVLLTSMSGQVRAIDAFLNMFTLVADATSAVLRVASVSSGLSILCHWASPCSSPPCLASWELLLTARTEVSVELYWLWVLVLFASV